MKNWYVVHALSGHEGKVCKALLDHREQNGMLEAIEEVLVPSELIAEVKRGKQAVKEQKLWPGYIMVRMEMSDDAWGYVKETNGVIDFLGGGKPTPLTQQEVDEILNKVKEQKDDVVPKYNINVGDNVKIAEGVFVNFTGTVTSVNQDKGLLSVVVSIFGRDTRVDDLEFAQVEKVSQD
ncbi:MAG: Transcription termination/antitermination protein NusG [Chlamydiia bacterium]|nr:Transcription termination/antitermination protein NusG [Chlamydiia bacterium]